MNAVPLLVVARRRPSGLKLPNADCRGCENLAKAAPVFTSQSDASEEPRTRRPLPFGVKAISQAEPAPSRLRILVPPGILRTSTRIPNAVANRVPSGLKAG